MSRTWLITGSSRGFGWELAKAVLATGDNLVATARKPEQLAALVDEFGDRVRTVALDVTDPAAAEHAVQVAVTEFGRLDIVVNNAGYADTGAIEDVTPEDFRAQIEANFFGVVNVTRAALPLLRQQRSGYFIQFSSIGGRVGGTPGIAAYQAAKFAVEGFSEVLANEVAPLGIKVIIIEPGAFRTDWQGSSMSFVPVSPDYDATVGEFNRYRERTTGTQAGDPARAARIIVDLLDEAQPPRRLLLGAGAVELAERSSRERAEEAAKWAEVSRSADFPG
ncbi:MAG TPA: oxidoreductase [Pseudonocardiaceae bacterium]|nr:oxidoreductase [Pseudonocardiaceae bacterium]